MTELQKRVSAIADRYNENARKLREYDAAIDGLMKTTVYSDEERRRQINEKTKARTEHLERSRTELAAAVKDAVEAERSAHTMQFQTAERETARANVLKMLEMAGNDLSPDQLQGLLAPFIEAGDRQSLDIFQTICRRTCPAAFDVSYGERIEDNMDKLGRFGDSLAGALGSSGIAAALHSSNAEHQLQEWGVEGISIE